MSLFKFPCTHAQSLETEPVKYLDQNWTPEVRQSFYSTPQGSHLIPLKFALALQDAQTGKPFFNSTNLKRYGFIPQKRDSKLNPFGFPVGLTVDGYTGVGTEWETKGSTNIGQRFVGMNCAACHTNNLNFNGTTIRIDGGQALLDFQGFVNGMDRALLETAFDKKKLARFLNHVKNGEERPVNKKQLLAEFVKFLGERTLWQRMNASQTRYGFGRVDAFGVIFNQVLARATKVHSNAVEPDAPVSYPVLWDTPHHDFVQWNGIASNNPATSGPLARNIGQVLGVFGNIDIFNPTEILKGYCGSPRRRGLLALENWTKSLVSPRWPENIFGEIDMEKANRGRAHYAQRCLNCHAELADTRSPDRRIQARLIPASILGVDSKLGDNSGRLVNSGPLKGRMTRLISGREMAEQEPATILLRHVVAGAVAGSFSHNSCKNKIDADPKMVADAWAAVRESMKLPPVTDPLDLLTPEQRLALVRQAVSLLKARPLNGIWASAPFLYNGSVKNLYEMLLPANQRATTFKVGCTDYDPVLMGYTCEPNSRSIASERRLSTVDTRVPGSFNTGHEYGTDLTDEQRMDLLEYLKSL